MVAVRDAIREISSPIRADLLENDDAYLLVIDLPGATPEHTRISTADGSISVRAERGATRDDATVIHEERPPVLAVDLPLPDDAEGAAARASLADGVLEVTIPRGTPGVTIPIEED